MFDGSGEMQGIVAPCENHTRCAWELIIRGWPSGTGRQPEDFCPTCPLHERRNWARRFGGVPRKPTPKLESDD
jgi:hypothetical protein